MAHGTHYPVEDGEILFVGQGGAKADAGVAKANAGGAKADALKRGASCAVAWAATR